MLDSSLRRWLVGLTLTLSLSVCAQAPKTARDYYSELDKANGLEGFSNMYVCFRDDPNEDQFLTFSRTEDIARLFPWETIPAEKRAATKAEFEKPGLLMLGYKKGVQVGSPYLLDREAERDDSWIMPMKIRDLRIHFTINWKTLRYRWSVEQQKHGIWSAINDSFGKCEDRTATR